MGKNFYVRTNRWDFTKESEILHVGKGSAGWSFSFRGYQDRPNPIRKWSDWEPILYNGRIYDEYDQTWSFNAFKELVDNKRSEPRNHAREYGDDLGFESWIDDQGNSFSGYEFS